MGYYCYKDVAEIVEPSEIALANNPNFVVFSSKKSDESERYETTKLKVVSVGKQKANLKIEITETQTNITHTFTSTYDPNKVNDKTFLVVENGAHLTGDPINISSSSDGTPMVLTALNLKNCLMQNSWLRNNFEITTDISGTTTEAGTLKKEVYETSSITIQSKGFGPQYKFTVAIKYEDVLSPQSDYSISLANLDYSNLDVSTLELTLYGHYLRAAITGIILGDAEKNDENYFKVIFPDANRSVKQARLETLKNLKDSLLREFLVTENLRVYLNEEDMRIDCSYIANSWYMLDDITSSTIPIQKGNTIDFVKITSSKLSETNSTDTIDFGCGEYRIELDVYADHGVFPGNPDTNLPLGKYVTTLSKSYFGRSSWFDLSSLLSKKVSYSPAFLTKLELDPKHEEFKLWCDAGTMTDYRFIAKRTDGKYHTSFYYSSPLYVLNGYNYTLNPLDLKKDEAGNSYILDFSQNFSTNKFTKVKPLTTNFIRTHIKGQRQYFNYVHKYIAPVSETDKDDLNLSPSIGLHYKIYTQSGVLIGKHTENGVQASKLNKVNTALLALDKFLPMYNDKIVGRIEVYLCRWHKSEYLGVDDPEVIVSTPLTFRIMPEVLNSVNDFAFLNQLGGWDTINFGGSTSSEFKSTSSTIYKTLLPDPTLQTEIESVALKSTQEQKIAQTTPVTTETLQWMRQLSASPAVYELSTKRYILIDDMTLKYNSTDDLYQVEMKYHYTDNLR